MFPQSTTARVYIDRTELIITLVTNTVMSIYCYMTLPPSLPPSLLVFVFMYMQLQLAYSLPSHNSV